MAPPQLAGNDPVVNVVHPVQEGVLEAFRDKVDLVRPFLILDRGLSQWLHLDEPLRRQPGFDLHPGAFGMANAVDDWLNFDQVAAGLQRLDQVFAALEAVLALILASVFVHRAVVVHTVNAGQVVAVADLKVVRVMRRRDLHRPGAKLGIGMFVGDDGNLSADAWHDDLFPDHRGIAFVVGIHGHGGIAKHRLRPRGGYFDAARRPIGKFINQMVKCTLVVFVNHFDVGQRGARLGIPVDDVFPTINQPLL